MTETDRTRDAAYLRLIVPLKLMASKDDKVLNVSLVVHKDENINVSYLGLPVVG